MNKKISKKLPVSSPNDIEGLEFEKYIKENDIITNDSLALAAYQGANTDNLSYLSAKDLNHTLTLIEHGEDSAYAKENIFGSSLDEYEYEKSLNELDKLFNNEAYSFSSDSIVYKGVRDSFCYYKILDLDGAKVGDRISFPGFLSTTVSQKKAKDFISFGGFLLVISGLDNAKCIVPRNSKIINSPTSNESEQEILLNRGTLLEIIEYNQKNREIKCKVIPA